LKTRLAASFSPRLALIVACCLTMSACQSLRMPNIWPFHKKAKPVPEAVNELNLVNADGSPANFPQYWKRNTLIIDLSGVGGAGMGATGAFAARLPEQTTWPVRVGVRVRPGSVAQIEIQGEERNVLSVATEGTQPIDLEFAPSVYTPNTAAIYISWGPMPVFVEAAPAPETPEFVSPTEVPKPATETASPPADVQPAPPGTR